ncbi:recombinase family protein [Corynebacterium xerosis]|uniref:recombinase family protein n=1 Tax=Corynebacterium xerosis TaxID=1725 RepID=UPI000EACB12E|nr:recombinase family protein [Corynebacterium xerosis]AYJ33015.1 recombinase family protein [Corynebacterium xerosis]
MTTTGPTGQRVGYVRVSTADQNAGRQLDGIALDRVFTDAASGATKDRPELQALLAYVREGDTVYVHSLDRLGRSLRDVQEIIETLTARGVRVDIVTQGLTFTGKNNPMSKLLLQMLGAVAEFELAQIRERQAQGIAKAKAAGRYTGRKPALSPAQIAELRRRADAGEAKAALARDLGVSRATIYNYLT